MPAATSVMPRDEMIDIGMNALPSNWRVFRVASGALYLLLASAFALGVCVGVLA